MINKLNMKVIINHLLINISTFSIIMVGMLTTAEPKFNYLEKVEIIIWDYYSTLEIQLHNHNKNKDNNNNNKISTKITVKFQSTLTKMVNQNGCVQNFSSLNKTPKSVELDSFLTIKLNELIDSNKEIHQLLIQVHN